MIILHIGLHKCASSYLQSILFSNRHSLKQSGFHYINPVSLSKVKEIDYKNNFAIETGNMSLPLMLAFGENIKKWHIFDENNINLDCRKRLSGKIQRRLLNRINKIEKKDIIFLSGEDLSHNKIPIQTVRKTLKFLNSTGHDIRILALVRNAHSLTTSIVQQKVKGGWNIESLSKIGIPLYKERLQNWHNECIKNAIPINIYCIENLETTVEDFILNKYAMLKPNVKPEDLRRDKITPNESLTNSQARTLSKANEYLNKLCRKKGIDGIAESGMRRKLREKIVTYKFKETKKFQLDSSKIMTNESRQLESCFINQITNRVLSERDRLLLLKSLSETYEIAANTCEDNFEDIARDITKGLTGEF